MKIGNLGRAKEIAEVLPKYREARAYLSQNEGRGITIGGILMPSDFSYRVIQALNLEINELQNEIESL